MEMYDFLKVTVYCDFDFQSYPFDEQECDFSLFEVVYDMNSVILEEVEDCLRYGGNRSQYLEKGWISLPERHEIPYTVRMKTMGTKNVYYEDYPPFSYQTIRFVLKRNSRSLLIGSFYVPTGLFAFLSMGSFIINAEIVSIRCTEIFMSLKNLGMYVFEIQAYFHLYISGSWKDGAFDNFIPHHFQFIWFYQFHLSTI